MWKRSTQYKYYLADNKVIIYCLYTQPSYVLQKYNTFKFSTFFHTAASDDYSMADLNEIIPWQIWTKLF